MVVVIDKNGEAWIPDTQYHQYQRKGFTFAEAQALIETDGRFEGAKIYFIEDELKKYIPNFDMNYRGFLDTKEEYQYKMWHDLYMNKNIKVDKIPQKVEINADYEKKLFLVLDSFLKKLQKPPFIYNTNLINTVKKNCDAVKAIFTSLKEGHQSEAEVLLKEMLQYFTEGSFFYGDLDKSYAFKGVAPFPDLHMKKVGIDYENMMKTSLTFFRVRTKKPDSTCDIASLEDIVHLPYRKKNKASIMRYSNIGIPCLYLGVTSFICAKECQWKIGNTDDMYASVFVPNDKGRKLKIFDLTYSQHLINGMSFKQTPNSEKWQSDMLKLYPLLFSISFTVNEEDRKTKYEYLISQCLMKVMHEVGIDGIAYLSAQGENEFQYPQGVNLALPAYDISDSKQFSEYCSAFEISKPVKFDNQDSVESKSYINTIYKRYLFDDDNDGDNNKFENFTSTVSQNGKSIYYGETVFGKFDNYLCSLPRETLATSGFES